MWLQIRAIETWRHSFGLVLVVLSTGIVAHIALALFSQFVLENGRVLFEAPKGADLHRGLFAL